MEMQDSTPPPITNSLPPTNQPSLNSSKNILFVILGVILLFVIFIGVGYYFVMKKNAPPSLSPSKTSVEITSDTVTTPTFTLRYPTNWNVESTKNGVTIKSPLYTVDSKKALQKGAFILVTAKPTKATSIPAALNPPIMNGNKPNPMKKVTMGTIPAGQYRGNILDYVSIMTGFLKNDVVYSAQIIAPKDQIETYMPEYTAILASFKLKK